MDSNKKQTGTFAEGYMDGWHSIKPGTDPSIPARALPAGKTDYEYGYEQGRAAAKGEEK